MSHQSKSFFIRMKGDLACFTRPEMKVERVSYEVMTPSAARGAIQAVFWRPEITWHIHKIIVCAPIRWTSFRRNEVQSVRISSSRNPEIFVEKDRTQRNTVALRNVDYVVEARLELNSPEISGTNNVVKYVDQFLRRLKKGQFFHAPCLGCREFAAQLSVIEDPSTIRPHPELAEVDRPLGRMFYDFDWQAHEANPKIPPQPLFFEARLRCGVLAVPPIGDVKARMEVRS